ncbi:MAG TPA: hypothetical protein VG537_05105 [Candidatus Kapabacteria bacterium]|jgi:hypothetical protein|nr:hypothetical protein [Candidatus Kapabacteria bacterium]
MTLFKILFIATIIGVAATIGFALHEHVHSERWQVKTLSDGYIPNDQPITTTIEEQRILPNPTVDESVGRLNCERTKYTLDANLIAVKKEFDGDYHLVLEDPKTHARIIAEIPDTNNQASSAYHKAFSAARAEVDSITGKPGIFSQIIGRKPKHPTRVRVTGVGFFDEGHLIPQSGVAINDREIHPVLAIAVE